MTHRKKILTAYKKSYSIPVRTFIMTGRLVDWKSADAGQKEYRWIIYKTK